MSKWLCVGAAIALFAIPAAASADTTGSYGDVEVVNTGPASNPEVFQLTSNTSGAGYAGIYFGFDSLLLSDITELSTDYQMVEGTFGGGAPRFTFFDNDDFTAYVYFGTPTGGGAFSDPLAGGYGNTGNYADLGATALRVSSNGFGGLAAPNTQITWADFVSQVGGTSVAFITIDLDAGTFTNLPDGQQALVDNFTVNNSVLAAGAVPEPATWAMMILGFGGIGATLRRRKLALAA